MKEIKWTLPSMDDYQKQIMALVTELIRVWNNPEERRKAMQNFMLFCGRQVGKSEIVAYATAILLINIPKIKLLIISGVERQAATLYQKTLLYIENDHKNLFRRGKDRPMKTRLQLKNGSELITEPVGIDGASARRHTLHGIIFEEMQLIPEEAFTACTPMLMTTGGFMWMLGTAWATDGYVYDRLKDEDFLVIRVNSEEVVALRPEPNRTMMMDYLEKERKRLTEAQYAQEYLAIPQDNARQVFNDKLIARVMTGKRREGINSSAVHICGLDPAGLGEDEGDIAIFEAGEKGMFQIDNIITKKLLTTETTQQIIQLYKRYDFEKIYVDDGGVGFGVFSELFTADETRSVTEALNNSSRSLNTDDKSKRIMKDDLVFNLLNMMEKGEIELLSDPEIRESLKSYRFEYDKDSKRLLIKSNYNHPTEAIMRAAWYWQTKGLNMTVYTIKV